MNTIIAIIDRHHQQADNIVQLLTEKRVVNYRSYTYSLQVHETCVDTHTTPGNFLQKNSILILINIGVRYDNARQLINERDITVYRVDTLEDLQKLLQLLEDHRDPSAYLADLDE